MLRRFLLALCLLSGSLALYSQTDCDCDFDFEPVCVMDADGSVIGFPNACWAECEGFGAEDYVDCGDGGEGPECDCGFDFEPVCVADADGNIIGFPNACWAECEGFGAEDYVDCGDGGEGPDCDCEFDLEPVCVVDADGNIIPFPNACFAECEGFTMEDYVDCGEIDPGIPDCDCDLEEFDPVCVLDENGDIFPFPNACFAECFGYTTDDLTECGDLGGGGEYDCDCDFDVFEPVCVVDEFGDIIPFPNACFAECCGYTEEDFTDCGDIDCGGGEYEGCDCDFEFDPVCVVDENGDVLGFPNACLAECLGYETEDFVDCGDVGEGPDCDCDFDFEPVCVALEDGTIVGFPNACWAECEGYGAEDFVDCGDGGEGPGCDCDFELNPVCVEDADGNLIPFPNACWAECEGYGAEDFVDCEFINDDPHTTMEQGGLITIFGLEEETGSSVSVLSAAPNPVLTNVQLSWKAEQEGDYQLQIIDLSGKLVQQLSGVQVEGFNSYDLNLSDQVAGVYIVRLRSGTEIQTIKVTKL